MRTDANWFPLGADTSFLGSGSGYLRRGSPRPSQALGAAPASVTSSLRPPTWAGPQSMAIIG